MQNHPLKEVLSNWRAVVQAYQKSDTQKALIQLLNSFLPFFALLVLMYFSLSVSYLLTLGLAVITAFFLVRIFIIQHDCGHQSFLTSRKWNNTIGWVASFLTMIPYHSWSRNHGAHHAHNGQLEYRGLGDINFLTTEEYASRSWWGRLGYRFFRMPLVQFILIPILYLTLNQRNPYVREKKGRKLSWKHTFNNLGMVVFYVGMAWLLGWKNLLMIYLPVVITFIVVAFWFFYVQHQHEENYKADKDDWDHLSASILGSTYYKLPRMVQWLTGNIGFHHIHHLNPRIPNYNLEACVRENPLMSKYVPTLTFFQSLKCMNHKLWDVQTRRMISFREFGRRQMA